MTRFAFILGGVPPAKASRAGGLSRQVMGFTVIGGRLATRFIASFLILSLDHLIERRSGSKRPVSSDVPEPPQADA